MFASASSAVFLLLVIYASVTDGNDDRLLDANQWSDSDIASRIEIRLVKRTWFPLPAHDTGTLLQSVSEDDERVRGIVQKSPLYEFSSWSLKDVEGMFSDPAYDPRKESIVIVHPTLQDGSGTFTRTTVAVLCLRNFHLHYNIFAVNMQEMDPLLISSIKRMWFGRSNKIGALGRVISGFLQTGINLKKLDSTQINLIGWSISSQIVGYVARALPGQVSSIVALNPLNPGLWKSYYLEHVSRRDARTVHAFHTAPFYQSTSRRVATADFVFNNGHVQPGCLLGASDCSLAKAVYYFWHFILYPDRFVAKQCNNYIFFECCFCEKKSTVQLKYPLDEGASGKYYIMTSEAPPYGLGSAGASCRRGDVIGQLHNWKTWVFVLAVVSLALAVYQLSAFRVTATTVGRYVKFQ